MVFMYCYEKYLKLQSVWKREHLRLEKYSRVGLLLNPNIATFWNLRKNLISNHLSDAQTDLLLSKIVLSWKPKCVEALSHRRWLFRQTPSDCNWLADEMELCTLLSNKVKCNYHIWSHRQWIFVFVTDEHDFNLTLWLSEFAISEEWTKYHLSDHSGWHYRQFLLKQLYTNLSKCAENIQLLQEAADEVKIQSASQFYTFLLSEEIRKNGDLILRFSGHESLWYYRRFLIQNIPGFLPRSEESFLDLCKSSSPIDFNQQRSVEQHRRWLYWYL